MSTQLLLPLAVLSLIALVDFFVTLAAEDREYRIAAEADDRTEAILDLLSHRTKNKNPGAAAIVVPGIILTLLGNTPSWVVVLFWLLTASALYRVYLVHHRRGRRSEFNKLSTLDALFASILMIAVVPGTAALFLFTVYAAWAAV